jgi:hypothetical protein
LKQWFERILRKGGMCDGRTIFVNIYFYFISTKIKIIFFICFFDLTTMTRVKSLANKNVWSLLLIILVVLSTAVPKVKAWTEGEFFLLVNS